MRSPKWAPHDGRCTVLWSVPIAFSYLVFFDIWTLFGLSFERVMNRERRRKFIRNVRSAFEVTLDNKINLVTPLVICNGNGPHELELLIRCGFLETESASWSDGRSCGSIAARQPRVHQSSPISFTTSDSVVSSSITTSPSPQLQNRLQWTLEACRRPTCKGFPLYTLPENLWVYICVYSLVVKVIICHNPWG